jgi:hypothetical protein
MDENIISFAKAKEKRDDLETLILIRRLMDSLDDQEARMVLKAAWTGVVAELFSCSSLPT